MAKRANSQTCTGTCQCTSGHCVDGYCCNTACTGDCRTCALPPGNCSNVLPFQDPDNDCGRYTCTGNGTCYVGCDGVCGGGKCKDRSPSGGPGSWCAAGSCVADLPPGGPCISGCQCTANLCLTPIGPGCSF
ncbi:MAG: hypothetical protein JNJ54_36060 [Myxococcaceae bacterium]|nr:hypothetical protein [Myxococcaceae bacterium]